jgi:phenylalanyl-tRNA synthetase alpha chain
MSTTKLLYLTNSYLKESEAKIQKIETLGNVTAITLNQTIFYPTGGGQLYDTGTIESETGSLKITEVLLKENHVVHYGKLSGQLSDGQTVSLELDWDRRYEHIQQHSAGHLLDEVVKDLLPDHHGIKGMHGIGNKFYITFSGFIDTVNQDSIQSKLNELIAADEPINTKLTTKAEIEAEGIFLPFKLPENKPLRLLIIGDRAPVPDGGTQLSRTSECWPVTITEFTYDEGNTTIHYQVAKPTIESHSRCVTLELPDFQTKLKKLQSDFSSDTLDQSSQTKYLGKNGLVNQLAKDIPQLSVADRKAAGQLLNQLKKDIELKLSQLIDNSLNRLIDFHDYTAPGTLPPIGHLHLISEAIAEIESIFSKLGFIRRRYPEIETDWYYAEGLNIPKDHPARDDQETFYFSDNVVLTAHTSNGQLREMEYVGTPPIKMINIGKTYRRQASNTHSPMFHQFEGLLIDKNINITHLIGVSNYFAKEYFGSDREIRLRPHHFQFTEPSFEVDINCHLCKGEGEINGKKCKVCKSGWLELGGAGMVHPNVLKNGGIDTAKYTGFAFGWGVERVIMMKHAVTDNLRQLYTDDLRFLNQS